MKILMNIDLVFQGGFIMKGFFVTEGYMGFVNGNYILFASESDYKEYIDAA